MGEEVEMERKKRVVVESLGWLTESSIMPKKQRAIAGVGASSILELKAQLYKSQEEAKLSIKEAIHSDLHLEVHRAKQKIAARDAFSHKNSGVDARASKDKLELKAIKDGLVSYAALEKKAALYDKLARGELSDEEDKEKYSVDFFTKSLNQDKTDSVPAHDASATEHSDSEDRVNDATALPGPKAAALGRTSGTLDSSEHKRFVREVHEEANQAREKATELKLRRQEQVANRREKLRQAYLRKQLEKMKAASSENRQT